RRPIRWRDLRFPHCDRRAGGAWRAAADSGSPPTARGAHRTRKRERSRDREPGADGSHRGSLGTLRRAPAAHRASGGAVRRVMLRHSRIRARSTALALGITLLGACSAMHPFEGAPPSAVRPWKAPEMPAYSAALSETEHAREPADTVSV